MSATRDKDQKVTFIYSNIYQIYKDSKDAQASESSNGAQASETAASPKVAEQIKPAPAPRALPVVRRPQPESGRILKTGKIGQGQNPGLVTQPKFVAPVRISGYQPREFLAKRIETRSFAPKPTVLAVAPVTAPSVMSNPVLDGLKENLKTLNDLHSKLRFMLEELEDLVKE